MKKDSQLIVIIILLLQDFTKINDYEHTLLELLPGFRKGPVQEKRPSSRDDGGVSWVFSSCGASIRFLTRYDGELREPLVWC